MAAEPLDDDLLSNEIVDNQLQEADAILDEYKLEQELKVLMRNCKLGIRRSCELMMNIMLMNSNKK